MADRQDVHQRGGLRMGVGQGSGGKTGQMFDLVANGCSGRRIHAGSFVVTFDPHCFSVVTI